MWEEYLNFFFAKGTNLIDQLEVVGWWTRLDEDGNKIETKRTPEKSFAGFEDSGEKREENSALKMLKEWEDQKMTPALELLMQSRRVKTEQEVEDDFNNR